MCEKVFKLHGYVYASDQGRDATLLDAKIEMSLSVGSRETDTLQAARLEACFVHSSSGVLPTLPLLGDDYTLRTHGEVERLSAVEFPANLTTRRDALSDL